ncbi:MAG TPA: dihydrofolate reductase family protein [Kofleriaceae bacterium]|jgi:dihydrofolate reductase|nr:dihydrofolate reductase family protein [Kofleriaceae bacterium]
MRKVSVFNSVSLDGYFTDARGDMSWAHKNANDPEWQRFTNDNAAGGGTLLFGRKTYEMMKSFWPTPQAKQQMPKVAEVMTTSEKIVFSKTLKDPGWQNVKVISDDLVSTIVKLKASDGSPMVIMGSGTLITQLAKAGLVDEFQIIVVPVVLGSGRTMFEGNEQTWLKLVSTRKFNNGNTLLHYVRS